MAVRERHARGHTLQADCPVAAPCDRQTVLSLLPASLLGCCRKAPCPGAAKLLPAWCALASLAKPLQRRMTCQKQLLEQQTAPQPPQPPTPPPHPHPPHPSVPTGTCSAEAPHRGLIHQREVFAKAKKRRKPRSCAEGSEAWCFLGQHDQPSGAGLKAARLHTTIGRPGHHER